MRKNDVKITGFFSQENYSQGKPKCGQKIKIKRTLLAIIAQLRFILPQLDGFTVKQ
jgi:hypothetical protein